MRVMHVNIGVPGEGCSYTRYVKQKVSDSVALIVNVRTYSIGRYKD